MCGIAGILSTTLTSEARDLGVRRMVNRQHHRGPDDTGFTSDTPMTIGMARLAIIDPAHGHQPMVTDDGRYSIVFNGAIYNYPELQSELRAAGYHFKTNCDTEVLLAAFATYGAACLPRLRGMFAFAIWDARDRRLFVARDALGIKPLFYARLPHGMIFGSEINALLSSGLVSREIDSTSVGEYLAWFAVPAPRTIYRGIANLPPGHFLTVSLDGRVKSASWWHLPAPVHRTRTVKTRKAFNHELRHQLEDTIRAHRIADVPVGAFLSGGMDSSAVVGLMVRSGASNLRTFSLVFDEAEYSEGASARLAAQAFGTVHHEEVLSGARVAADIPRLLAAYDQPTGDGVNTYYVSQAARAGGVTVALSGLGGDELFGGYPSFRDLPKLERLLLWWRRMPERFRGPLVERLRTFRSARARKLADFLASARDLHELASLQRRVLPEAVRLSLLAPEAARAASRLGPNHPMLDDFVGEMIGADDFQIISGWELRTYMSDVLLRDSDVFSMAHSLELRVPFVDTHLLEWLWPQRAEFKYDRSGNKRALADAVADIVPAEIINRKKQGFALPFARWMRKELRPFLDETFSDSSLANCPWLDATATQGLWREYLASDDSRAWSRVWTIAVLIAFANRSADPVR